MQTLRLTSSLEANVGTDCYILDDQTVSKTNQAGTLSRAGKVVAVDTLGVWVRIGLGDWLVFHAIAFEVPCEGMAVISSQFF